MYGRRVTPDEIATVAAVIAKADGGCLICVADLACKLDRDMPWVGWLAEVAAESEWSLEQLEENRPCRST